MKKLLLLAIVFQLYLVSRAPCGLSAESLLAGRAITQGQVPYRDFLLHVGPLPAYLFAALFSVPVYAWCSLVFIGFNLLTAWGIYNLGGAADRSVEKPDALDCESSVVRNRNPEHLPSLFPSILFLFIAPLYGGNEMYIETIMTAFGVWGIVFAARKQWWFSWPLFACAVATKQTGAAYALASLFV